MGDKNYEKLYLKRKNRIRKIHKRLIETKENQETYHKLLGSKVEGDLDSTNIE
jgi:hypothetical protein